VVLHQNTLEPLGVNFMYQRVLKIQPSMFEKKLQVLNFFIKNISSNEFGMLKTYSLNKEENIETSKSPYA
jgi:hypothetical protein